MSLNSPTSSTKSNKKVCPFRAQIVILSLPGVNLGVVPCLVLEYLVDVSVFYRTIGGLGIAVFRQTLFSQIPNRAGLIS